MHVSMRNYNHDDLIATLAAMHRAGRPCPAITLLGPDEIQASKIRAASPGTIIISRVVYPGDGGLGLTAAQYLDTYVAPDAERKQIKYHQINNEANDFSEDAINWWYQQMATAEGRGYRLAVPTWSTGNPPDLKVWKQPYIHAFLRYVRDHGHLLTLHEYYRGDLRWNLGRFITYAYPWLADDVRVNMPRVVFTEFGEQGGRDWSTDDTLTRFREWQKLMEPYGWIVGASVWAVGDTGAGAAEDWTGDNLAAKLPLWTQV